MMQAVKLAVMLLTPLDLLTISVSAACSGDSLSPRNPERPVDLCGVREISERTNKLNADSRKRLASWASQLTSSVQQAASSGEDLHRIGLVGFSVNDMLQHCIFSQTAAPGCSR